jgi:hypothetical protein
MDEMMLQRQNLKRSLQLQTISQMNNIKNALKKIESNKESLRQAPEFRDLTPKLKEFI